MPTWYLQSPSVWVGPATTRGSVGSRVVTQVVVWNRTPLPQPLEPQCSWGPSGHHAALGWRSSAESVLWPVQRKDMGSCKAGEVCLGAGQGCPGCHSSGEVQRLMPCVAVEVRGPDPCCVPLPTCPRLWTQSIRPLCAVLTGSLTELPAWAVLVGTVATCPEGWPLHPSRCEQERCISGQCAMRRIRDKGRAPIRPRPSCQSPGT